MIQQILMLIPMSEIEILISVQGAEDSLVL